MVGAKLKVIYINHLVTTTFLTSSMKYWTTIQSIVMLGGLVLVVEFTIGLNNIFVSNQDQN